MKTTNQALQGFGQLSGRQGGGASAAQLPGMDIFKSYYSQILGMMSVPGISVSVPSRGELQKDFEASMRPGVDIAISNRRDAGERTKAELDADAASRGMTGSSFLSSMKEREGDDVERDISNMETQYGASLAERIQDALMQYKQMSMQAQMFNAQMYQSASDTAMGIASDWYSLYLSSLGGSSKRSSGGAASNNFDALTRAECERYVSLLNGAEKRSLFNSGDEYWTERRGELQASLGRNYEPFKRFHTEKGTVPKLHDRPAVNKPQLGVSK